MNNLTVHCVVKNEERWVWYALSSVIDIADELIVFDTGSNDKTVEIIKTIKSKKIIFEEKGEVSAKSLVDLRRQQLRMTKTKWFLILDGDEIWPNKTKKELIERLKSANKNDWAVVVRAWNFVGDSYHVHPESIRYHWPFAPKSWQGWANLRLISTEIPGLGIKGEYPLEYYHDKTGTPIQNYGQKHLVFLKNRYFHTTYLQRSSSRKRDKKILNRTNKWKLELGYTLPKNVEYPEVFYKKKPKVVQSPFYHRPVIETLVSVPLTPVKEIRRRLLKSYQP